MKQEGFHNQTHLSPDQLTERIGQLENRREDIIESIHAFWIKYGMEKKYPDAEGIEDRIKILDLEDAKDPFVDCKMQGEVQSYDLLANEKYARLEELKTLLDSNVKTTNIITEEKKVN